MNVFVDTEIWSFAQKMPVKEKFRNKLEYERFLKVHMKAKSFLKKVLRKEIIYMSLHQVAEIFHVLSFRGFKLPMDFVVEYVNAFETVQVFVSICERLCVLMNFLANM